MADDRLGLLLVWRSGKFSSKFNPTEFSKICDSSTIRGWKT